MSDITALDGLLAAAARARASDVHVTADRPALMRVDGDLMTVEGYPEPLSAEWVERAVLAIMSNAQAEDFATHGEVDLSYASRDLGRFRVNVFRQVGAVAVAFRFISTRVSSLAELGAPPVARELALKPRGLVLVTGPTGSGKATTLTAMGDIINSTHASVLMSGTLTPTAMYAQLLGADDPGTITLRSPFPRGNRLNIIVPKTTTRFTTRSPQMYEAIAKECASAIDAVPGNCTVFFPSYQILGEVRPHLERLVHRTTFAEHPSFTREEREEVLARFTRIREASFGKLSETQSRSEIIITFLALLHLAREQLILLEQKGAFSDIIVRKNN